MKIFELVIDENDEISGTQYLSLVKSPANLFEWEVFGDEEPHDCSRHFDFTDDVMNVFDKYGETLPVEFFVEGEQREIELTEEGFAAPPIKSNPRSEDIGWDNPQTDFGISRYVYVVDTGLGAPLIKTSRTMCRKLILAQKVFRRSDINDLSRELQNLGEESFKYVFRKKGLGVDIWNYKMGKNDRHCWRELVFYKKPNETFEELLKRVPTSALAGTSKADLVNQGATRPYVAEAKIPNGTGQLELFSSQERLKPLGFHMGLFLYRDKFSCLVGEPEAQYLSKIKLGDKNYWVGANVMDSYLEDTGKVVDKFKVKHNFVKVPEYVREVAKRVVDYTQENGWGDCGTPVGKKRANDLSDPNYDASIDILTRMYSYGSRHKQDWESSKDFESGCGFKMMAAWGFSPSNYDQTMSWLERQINDATEMSVKFSTDEYKGDITAVVFEPDTYIYRYDPQTDSPYYVFMSRETIEKMLKKFSRLKEMGKIKNTINLEHTDKVFDANEVYSYENWLVGDNPKEDKSYQVFGREMKPGTWITTIHFKNKELFDRFVLSKSTTGISLEGMFQEIPFNFEEIKKQDFVEPRGGETEDEFISRCMSELQGEFPRQDQRIAVCYSYWKERFNYDEDREMVEGVIDLLLQVKDLENRKEMVRKIIKDFANEGVSYDYDNFIQRLGLIDFGFDFPSGTCWDGYEPYGTKIVDGKEVPNCVPIRASKNTFAPYDWDKCISDMTERYGSSSAPRICGKIRSENMSMLGIYGGVPTYSTEGEADEMSSRLGCKGTHYEEGAGWMPCKTHEEASDLYDNSLLLFTLKEMLGEYLSNENKQ